MTGIDVRLAGGADARRLAELHTARISSGFLTSLGPRFLERLYRRVVRSDNAFAFVAEEGGEVVGFCAAAENVRRFYVEFVARDGIATVASAPRIVRRLPRVLETLRYPVTGDGTLPHAEILAVATDATASSRGYGRALVQRSVDELHSRGCPAAKVVAGSDNVAALRLYEGCGFASHARISIHDDVPSEVMVWARS
jgi:ribosomal protein S18 acetylase RimI-like enzyme